MLCDKTAHIRVAFYCGQPKAQMCASVSSLLTPDDTHDLCVFCLGEEHARDVIEGGNLRAL